MLGDGPRLCRPLHWQIHQPKHAVFATLLPLGYPASDRSCPEGQMKGSSSVRLPQKQRQTPQQQPKQ